MSAMSANDYKVKISIIIQPYFYFQIQPFGNGYSSKVEFYRRGVVMAVGSAEGHLIPSLVSLVLANDCNPRKGVSNNFLMVLYESHG